MPTPFEALSSLDRLVHEPARLAILTALSEYSSRGFVDLQSLTGLTKGNLSNHLQKLEHAGLVSIDKRFRGRVPQTLLALTPDGRRAIDDHWTCLKVLRDEARLFRPVPDHG